MNAMVRDTESTMVVDHGYKGEYVFGSSFGQWVFGSAAERDEALAEYKSRHPGEYVWSSSPFVDPRETKARYHPQPTSPTKTEVTNRGCPYRPPRSVYIDPRGLCTYLTVQQLSQYRFPYLFFV